MASISVNVMIDQLMSMLQEAFEGSKQQWSYFTDGPTDSAFLGALVKLTAAEASRPMAGSSVAAHVHHVTFRLRASAAWIGGDRSSRDWQESWQVKTVDEVAWSRLQQELRNGHEELRQAIESHAASGAESGWRRHRRLGPHRLSPWCHPAEGCPAGIFCMSSRVRKVGYRIEIA